MTAEHGPLGRPARVPALIGRFPAPRRRVLALLPALAALSALLAACSSAGVTQGGGSKDVVLTTEASPSGPITDNFNPFYSSSALNTLGGINLIYEPLLQYNLMKPGQVAPWLASSYSWSNGGKTVTIHTRTGVRWSDGKPFSAQDVVFTLDLLKRYPAINANGLSFKTATASGNSTVVVQFAQPAYTQLYYLASTPIVPQHIWAKAGNPATFTDAHAVGTGPFVLSHFSPQGFKLTRNPDYWQKGLPKIKGLDFVVYDSNDSANTALQQGSLQWAGNFVPNLRTQFVSRDPQHNHYIVAANHTDYLIPNVDHYPLNMVAVRQAIAYAIDRQAISTEAENGYTPPAFSATGLTLPLFSSYLDPAYKNARLTLNDAKASALLKSAGFKKMPDGTLQMPNGKPFTLSLMAVTAYTEQITTGQIIVNDLKKIGIDASVQGVSLQAAIADTGDGSFDLSINGANVSPQPYDLYEPMLDYSLSAPMGKTATGDLGRFDNPAAQRYLAQLRTAANRAQEQQALNGLEGIMVSQMPVIPTVYGVSYAEWSTASVTGWPSTSDPYALPSPGNEVVALHLRPTG